MKQSENINHHLSWISLNVVWIQNLLQPSLPLLIIPFLQVITLFKIWYIESACQNVYFVSHNGNAKLS